MSSDERERRETTADRGVQPDQPTYPPPPPEGTETTEPVEAEDRPGGSEREDEELNVDRSRDETPPEERDTMKKVNDALHHVRPRDE